MEYRGSDGISDQRRIDSIWLNRIKVIPCSQLKKKKKTTTQTASIGSIDTQTQQI